MARPRFHRARCHRVEKGRLPFPRPRKSILGLWYRIIERRTRARATTFHHTLPPVSEVPPRKPRIPRTLRRAALAILLLVAGCTSPLAVPDPIAALENPAEGPRK